ncbi:MAG: tetratricopeptide repeat protein, partial [Deltaproteobacteria bacterium]|nr:tetratricopeptide repeat protein [Deltaproteobacteria bacterium]
LDTPGISSGEEQSARRGLALALSWTDQQQPALREYQALVAANPGDLDALRSVGRIQSWQGQHRRAVEQFENFLTQYPNDPEGIALLAQALDWMGRPDRAEKVLRDHLAVTPGDKNAERRGPRRSSTTASPTRATTCALRAGNSARTSSSTTVLRRSGRAFTPIDITRNEITAPLFRVTSSFTARACTFAIDSTTPSSGTEPVG